MRRRGHQKELKQMAHDERVNTWRVLGPEAQLLALDRRLGSGVGAGKQRARIAAQIEARNRKVKQ